MGIQTKVRQLLARRRKARLAAEKETGFKQRGVREHNQVVCNRLMRKMPQHEMTEDKVHHARKHTSVVLIQSAWRAKAARKYVAVFQQNLPPVHEKAQPRKSAF